MTSQSTLPRFAALDAADQWLVRKLQEIAFGRLTFTVTAGHAQPAAGYRLARTRKLAGYRHDARPQAGHADFVLKDEHVALLTHLRTLADGTVVSVKIVHGLPTTTLDVEESHQAA